MFGSDFVRVHILPQLQTACIHSLSPPTPLSKGTRSRTAEPRRPSQVSSTNSNGSRSSSVSRAVSTGRSRGGDREESARRRRSPSQGTPALSRRSSSVEMRDDGRTSPTPAVRRSSSSKRLQVRFFHRNLRHTKQTVSRVIFTTLKKTVFQQHLFG